MDVSVIIPAYNEEKRIGKTLPIIHDFFDKLELSYEILVVDDGSKDKTAQKVEDLNLSNTKVISYGENRGKGGAVNFGAKNAQGDWILIADADNSTPIEEFSKLFAEHDKFEVIIGSRYINGSNIAIKQSFSRRFASRLGNILIQILILPGIKDTQCGFKLFSKSAAEKIFTKQTIWRWGFDFEILKIARVLGYKIKEVPVTWYNDEGTRLQSSRVFTKTLSELLTVRKNSNKGLYKN